MSWDGLILKKDLCCQPFSGGECEGFHISVLYLCAVCLWPPMTLYPWPCVYESVCMCVWSKGVACPAVGLLLFHTLVNTLFIHAYNRYATGQIPGCIIADKFGGKFTLGCAILGQDMLWVIFTDLLLLLLLSCHVLSCTMLCMLCYAMRLSYYLYQQYKHCLPGSSILTLFVPLASHTSFPLALIVRALIGLMQAAIFPSCFYFFPR